MFTYLQFTVYVFNIISGILNEALMSVHLSATVETNSNKTRKRKRIKEKSLAYVIDAPPLSEDSNSVP